ncbi:30S ribosomal protein S12 methylthiotransferase RimO [Hippea maritima]|uniref:Ribosomal protein uS12 methylthiotransferase RimO n=1 Tax=Hippea maritima (strain ATCC 700847 / DSM 10411 / MH2) TaxID=760142 RepID=F2LWL5_HIPMA|nr:30S ribosomal protein S12 methylthiotransferase RimO [Hippea maritima]AEA34124.1 Ribosomal protein S12 methylthiotransferase rimO [Hippea maritima DSM 10411]
MKIYIESLGCPKNTADSEYMLGILKTKGCIIADRPEQADVLMVNTCGFIEPAKEESIDTILELAQLKKNDPSKRLIVCGCLYERYRQQLKEELPEVDGFLGVNELDRISDVVLGRSHNLKKPYIHRHIIGPKHIGYLKIADGCSNRCTFCAIPLIKGGFKSRGIDELVEEAEVLADKGVRELYITAQDTTAYMFEKNRKNALVELLKKLDEIEGLSWVRLMYTYPSYVTDELIEFMSTARRIVRYIDMPFQHASDRVLDDMGRGYTVKDMEKLTDKLRLKVKGVAIRSTFIVGFPTEEEKDFDRLLDFLEYNQLDWAGFFKYYHEEGTQAFKNFYDMDEETKDDRLIEAQSLALSITEGINEKFVGEVLEVIVDEPAEDEGYWIGRSYRSAYEIDGVVLIKADNLKPGDFVKVKIEEVSNQADVVASLV